MAHLVPFEDCPAETLRGFKAVLTDIDDTLTHEGRLPSEAFAALEALRAAGLVVIPVTGRPAGWCDHIARMWPADAVIGENGAFYFSYDGERKKMRRVYAQSAEERRANVDRLWKIARRIIDDYPGAAIASDQAYREIDVAIDFREDVAPLPLETAQAIARAFAAGGATAKVSSIHVNAWFGSHDKLAMARRCLREIFGIDADADRKRIAYAGDSPNDAPMFAHFTNAIGVANIRPFAKLMDHLPHYVTENEGGYGFSEFAQGLLAARADG